MRKILTTSLLLISFVVFAGYSAWEHSRDGSSVACGEGYSAWEHSRDGTDVCAGGQYSAWEHSRDGSSVAARWDGD